MNSVEILKLVQKIIDNLVRLAGRAIGNLANKLEYVKNILLEFFKGLWETLSNQVEFLEFIENN
jgi:hypothetical protein